MDICVQCHKSANFQCQRCKEFYCSNECQVIDWPNHKFSCIAMPALIRSNKTATIKYAFSQSEYMTEMRHPQIEMTPNKIMPSFQTEMTPNKIIPSFQTEMTPNKIISSFQVSNAIDSINDDLKSIEIKDKIKDTPHIQKSDKKIHNTNYIKASDETVSPLKEVCQETIPIPIESNLGNKTLKEKLKKDNFSADKNSWNDVKKFQENYFNAVVQYVDSKNKKAWVSDELWVEDSISLLSNIVRLNSLNELQQCSEDDVAIGNLIIVPFEDVLYRATALSKLNSKNELQVRLIDYGNDFAISLEKCKKPTDDLMNIRSFAFPIRCSRLLEISQIIQIRILEKDENNVYIVEEIDAQGSIIENLQSIEHFSITRKNIFTKIKNNFELKIFHRFDKNKRKTLGLILDGKETNEMTLKMNELLNSENQCYYDILEYPVANGSYVVALIEKNKWKRAIVLSNFKDTYLVLLIDVGRIHFAKKLKRIPEDFKSSPNPTVCLNFSAIKDKKEYIFYTNEYNVLSCKIKSGNATDDMFECSVHFGKIEIGTANFSVFNGNYKDFLGIDSYTYPFASGDLVQITQVVNHSELYLTLFNQKKLYDSIFEEAAKVSKSVLEENLIDGCIVFVKNPLNDKFIRTIILTKIDNLHYKVINIDSGEVLDVTSLMMREAPEFVKMCPRITRKIQLFNLNSIDPKFNTKKAVSFLQKYCNQDVFTFYRDKDLAELIFDGEVKISLNKLVLAEMLDEKNSKNEETELTQPTEEKAVSERNVSPPPIEEKLLNLNDLNLIPLETGNNIRLMVLDTSDISNGLFTASISDVEYYKKLVQIEHPRIMEHCQRKDIPQEYKPRVGELCLAFYDEDGLWYRAFCIEQQPNDQFNLMFLDYGNVKTSKSSELRKMTEDFLFPCYANTCIISGLTSNTTPDILKKINKIVQPDSFVTVKKVEKINEQEYEVTLPEIEDL